jgi:glycosyltransferase involved in cell wall biosynthesis
MQPHITIVTGTYNRITTLQRLIRSVRDSIPAPIRYEYIVVDNGSKDGTAKWVTSQPDLTLIQLGEPKGAIYAFTEGAYKAKADYVLLATDDITFPMGAILKAYSHLTSKAGAGAVTLAHNKNRNEYQPDWHPVRTEKDGIKRMYPYPQIALVRKWLGDDCGWWGARDGMKRAFTYGGDNYLGAQIVERGYSVDVVAGAVNNEAYILDEPRRMNQRKHKADAEIYFANFPNFPTLRTTPTIPQKNVEPLRVVFVAHWLNKASKREKRALISAWERVATVVEVDYANTESPDVFMQEIMDSFKPHLVFSQIHNSKIITPSMVKKIRMGSPETIWSVTIGRTKFIALALNYGNNLMHCCRLTWICSKR